MPSLLASGLSVLCASSLAVATLDWKRHPLNPLSANSDLLNTRSAPSPPIRPRQADSIFLNENTERFAVDGNAIPEVNFDVGESYSGLLPIGDANDTSELFFWFFPSANPSAEKEILIWLTGGPGCSSVGELLQENGPFLWQPGVFKPVPNKWSWHHLTNVVWIDQPVGTGFSQGTPTARNQLDVARQFLGFWRNFVDTFSMQGYKVYITGASYSGLYCSYIAHEMLEAEEPEYFDIGGVMLFNALYGKLPLSQDIPAATLVDRWPEAFPFNESYNEALHAAADECGYTQYLDDFLVYPPSGAQPADLPGRTEDGAAVRPECSLSNPMFAAAVELNACFNPYAIHENCPRPFDPLGFSGATMYMPADAGPVYFDRADVKEAIHAPAGATWEFCSSDDVFVDGLDETLEGGPAAQPVLPRVIEGTGNVIMGHGNQDLVVVTEGTLLAIQNLTWGGEMGFQSAPGSPLFVPYHDNDDIVNQAGAGILGVWHEERGLTYFNVDGAGHFLSMDLPAVAYRGLEVLLGRVENLQSNVPFTTDANATPQPALDLGMGVGSLGATRGRGGGSGNSSGAEATGTSAVALVSLALGFVVLLRAL